MSSKTLPTPPTPLVPPLVHGQRLSRDEFERRYAAMPDVKKAELIEGVVHMGSPVKTDNHAEPHFDLIGWLSMYAFETPGLRRGDNGTIRLDLKNEPQPDAFLLIDPVCGGRAGFQDGYVVSGPEFVAEVSASSAAVDLGVKRDAYRRNGVCEYLVWRVLDREIDWFVLRSGQYERLIPGPDRIYRSEVLPGLWLDGGALINCDFARVVAVVRQGIASVEHAEFVRRLATRRTSSGSP